MRHRASSAARRLAATLLGILLTALPAPAQRDVSLETLLGALEGRGGVFARNLRTQEELRLFGDVAFPIGPLRELILTDLLATESAAGDAKAAGPAVEWSRVTPLFATDAPLDLERAAWADLGVPRLAALSARNDASALRDLGAAHDATPPPAATPRALAAVVERVRASIGHDRAHPVARALIEGGRDWLGRYVSPAFETGAATTGAFGSPGAAGWVATPRGEVVIVVLTRGFESRLAGANLVGAVAEACVRRLAPGLVEAAPDELQNRARGLALISLHETKADATLFPPSADDVNKVVDLRRGRQRSKFRPGETARVAILARPDVTLRCAVQWLVPAGAGEPPTAQRVILQQTNADLSFDLPLLIPGSYRVRVAYDDRIAFDETFFVTSK